MFRKMFMGALVMFQCALHVFGAGCVTRSLCQEEMSACPCPQVDEHEPAIDGIHLAAQNNTYSSCGSINDAMVWLFPALVSPRKPTTQTGVVESYADLKR